MNPNSAVRKFFENIKFSADVFNSLMPIAKIVAGLLGVMMILLFANAHLNRQTNIEAYIASAEQFRNDAREAILFSEELKQEITRLEQVASVAMNRADGLNNRVETLRVERAVLREELFDAISSQPDSIDYEIPYAIATEIISTQDIIIETQSEEIIELRSIIDMKDQSIFLLTQSRDSLQTVLSNPPPVPSNPNKLFGINLPSRKASFITGAIAATVVMVVITN